MLWSSLLDRVDPARRAKVFIWRKVGPARRATLPSQKGDPPSRVTLLRWQKPSQLFVPHVNGSPSFVRKGMRSWLAQGSAGRLVTPPPGTTVLHINEAVVFCSFALLSCQTLARLAFGRRLGGGPIPSYCIIS